MIRYVILFLSLFLCVFRGVAQEGKATVSGHVLAYVQGRALSNEPLAGAVIEVFTPADTLYAATDEIGGFVIKQVSAGWIRVRASCLGYKPYLSDSLRLYRTVGLREPLYIELKSDTQQIDEVVVKGQIEAMTRNGDTIIYNAAAVRTMAGDDAIRILEQMPGVEINELGQIRIMGGELARTYVNGKLIFGDSPTMALNNLLAQDVVKMRTYEEATDEMRRRGVQGRKQRVLDIQTREPIFAVITGHALASYGADFEPSDGKRQQRYGIGVTGNLFSEKLLLELNAYSNNIGRTSNRMQDVLNLKAVGTQYAENHAANVHVSKFWGEDRRDASRVDFSYAYENQYARSGSHQMRNYFATSAQPARVYADTSALRTGASTHIANLDLELKPGSKHRITLNNAFRYSTPEGYSSQFISVGDDQAVERTAVLKRTDNRTYSIQNQLDYSLDTKCSVLVSLQSLVEQQNSSGWWLDTLSVNKRILETDYQGPHRHFTGDFRVNKNLSNNPENWAFLSLNYQFGYETFRKRQTALNTYDPVAEIDPTNTYNYTYDYTSHRIGLEGDISRSVFNVRAKLDVQTNQLNKSERYPESDRYGKRFTALLPFFSLGILRQGTTIDLFSYQASVALPSVEQLRERIDDANPLLLQAGNPRLKQSICHQFRLQYTTIGPAKMRYFTEMTLALWTNDIAARSQYYAQTTQLDPWNYLAPAGSTLCTYENMSGSLDLRLLGRVSRRIQPLRSSITVGLGYGFSRRPSYIGELLNRNYQHQPTISVQLRGTQSKNLRLTFSSQSAYAYVRNTQGSDTRYFRQTFGAEGELRFLTNFFVSGNYTCALYRYFSSLGRNTTVQLLNAAVGYRFSKGQGTLSVVAYDLLNRGSAYTTRAYADYELQRWQSSYGRYFTVNVGYKFNKTRKKVAAPTGMLNDGERYGVRNGVGL